MKASDDPASLRSPLAVRFFDRVFAQRMARAFAAVRIARADGDDAPNAGPAAPWPPGLAARLAGRPVVLYCNHPSWWDAAFLTVVAHRLLPGQPMYAPIEAEALDRYPFMKRCGAFAVEPGTHAGALSLLRIGRSLLQSGPVTLCITPEGGFTDARTRPLALRRGLAGLLARVPAAVALPMAIEYPFWNESRPEALVRFGEPVVAPHAAGRVDDTGTWQTSLTSHLERAMDRLGVDARSRDAGRFRTLLDGRVGVGGVYDGWRRVRAAWAGRRFDAAHDARAHRT